MKLLKGHVVNYPRRLVVLCPAIYLYIYKSIYACVCMKLGTLSLYSKLSKTMTIGTAFCANLKPTIRFIVLKADFVNFLEAVRFTLDL